MGVQMMNESYLQQTDSLTISILCNVNIGRARTINVINVIPHLLLDMEAAMCNLNIKHAMLKLVLYIELLSNIDRIEGNIVIL